MQYVSNPSFKKLVKIILTQILYSQRNPIIGWGTNNVHQWSTEETKRRDKSQFDLFSVSCNSNNLCRTRANQCKNESSVWRSIDRFNQQQRHVTFSRFGRFGETETNQCKGILYLITCGLSCSDLSKLSWFLERILIENLDIIVSSDPRLQISFISSIRIRSRQ